SGGGLLPRVALGSCGASLTLGYIRLPLWGTKWTDSQEKIEISAGNLRFLCYFIDFSALSGSLFPTN
ncbi:MAG: hypothetical protein PHG44_00265, partial [Lentisphaeria bacterium]|nr:hypothetical protein [Lentisphaeria bacterium]